LSVCAGSCGPGNLHLINGFLSQEGQDNPNRYPPRGFRPALPFGPRPGGRRQ
jgi:hypothetical protein